MSDSTSEGAHCPNDFQSGVHVPQGVPVLEPGGTWKQ